jgi:hypothetical protein
MRLADHAETAALAATAALALSVVGMMLVIGGVLVSGLFLPGVILIGIGMIAFIAAAVLHARNHPPDAA